MLEIAHYVQMQHFLEFSELYLLINVRLLKFFKENVSSLC